MDRCAKVGLVLFVISDFIQGGACGPDDGQGNVGGLVAAATAAFFCLIAIIIMLMVALLWRDWYMHRQLRKGRRRVHRRFTTKSFWRSQSQHSLTMTPQSQRKIKLIAAPAPGKHVTIDSREQMHHADAWVTSLPPIAAVEEKSKTIDFEAEEDAVIVADILPDQNNIRATHNLRYTQRNTEDFQHGATTTEVTSSQPAQPVITFTTDSRQQTSDMRTTYVPIGTEQATSSYMSIGKTAPTVISHEPYHVRAEMSQTAHPGHLSQTAHPGHLSQTAHPGHLSQTAHPGHLSQAAHTRQLYQTARPASDQHAEIFITPLIPAASNAQDENQEPDVIIFDSDDEAGNIPTTYGQKGDVLY